MRNVVFLSNEFVLNFIQQKKSVDFENIFTLSYSKLFIQFFFWNINELVSKSHVLMNQSITVKYFELNC